MDGCWDAGIASFSSTFRSLAGSNMTPKRSGRAVVPECIGITNQRETVVVWDKATGVPVHRAIVWQDRRTADRCVALAGSRQFIAERTGLVLDAYFSATKIEWLLRSNDGLMRRAMNGELLP